MTTDGNTEENLDPQDWDEMRALGHRMVDDMMDWLAAAGDRKVWQPVPEEAKDFFRQPMPREGTDAALIYDDFRNYILPYPMGNTHPRFWSWVMGNGTALGMLAEMLAAGLNPNVGGGEHSAIYVERQVIDWTREMLGFPAGSSGLLVSGGSMANLVGLTVARNAMAEGDARRAGLQACGAPLIYYASVEAHSSIQKAIETLGLGSDNLRLIDVDDAYRIDLSSLSDAIGRDRAAGLHPACVIGSAGTVNSGAVDDLEGLAGLARREGLWFHVDGAIGALGIVAPDMAPKLRGMNQADSVALDFHKWMYMQFEAGCVLVRDGEEHWRTFSLTPEYLASHGTRGIAAGSHWPNEYGIQLTRNFRALKVWMSLREHGIYKYGRVISQNAAQARYLARLVQETPELELIAPVDLNIVCFRYRVPGLSDEQLNELNHELLLRLHESGVAAPSYTTLRGRYALRAAITNHRSRREDFDVLVREVLRIGAELTDERVGKAYLGEG